MRRIIALLGLGLLAGCTVGPNYRAPEVQAPPAFGEAPSELAAQPQPSLKGWWEGYRDPELDRLIAIALQEAPDVKIAAARVAEARAQVREARAGFFPTVDGTAGFNYEKFSKNAGIASLGSLFGGGGGSGRGSTSGGGVTIPGGGIKTYSVGFDASWEPDLFGGARRQVESARAQEQAAEFSARDAQLSLIAEIADDYLQLRTLQDRERIARAEVDRQTRTLQIMSNTAKAGLLPQGDYVRQRAQLASAQAAVGPIVAEGKAQMHGLATLIGRTPDSLIEELTVPRPVLAAPPLVPPGLPADLLRRRPDVRAAERKLAAATADIGVAVADLFPKIQLTAMPSLLSTALGNLFTSDSLQVTAAAQASFPILDFGRRTAQVSLKRAQADEAYRTYQKAVLGALKDVEDALIRIRTEQQRNDALKAGLADAQRSAQAVEARYTTGLVDFGEVLNARQAVLQDQDQLAQSDGMIRRDLTSLYKALGGGWEDLPLADATPRETAKDYTVPKKPK
ncbi:NodT family efflux transporter outer membrane factor (OMF) lipoprotein [Sphingomonas vulcanisoli]|uniref:NodT family efflux transporter outer membrane factor (OMF) lipoprotein n=1 Tax=Sphingomonas vulcanisoli TaxID=1658060 RepID=A0ABX0TPU8_9SPHN|nr:efflux transporter outer membrane subunit [Sphingomonas vulcanisoli]NIJ07532.1 NodT family efflux transporter outer membrane factor (OMF) lipoprotein [Sphingomonas vulcanisoli]